MKTITSRDFYKTWLQTVNQNKTQLIEKWRSNTEFTSFMIYEKDSIVCQISEKLDLLCYNNDYYSIDAVFYKSEDLVPEIGPNQIWLRDIKIGFEHENHFKSGLYQEVSHLLLTNAELKVLVSYPNNEPDEQLKYLHEIIINTRHASELSKNESFIIILGYETGFAWEGYIFNEAGWVKL